MQSYRVSRRWFSQASFACVSNLCVQNRIVIHLLSWAGAECKKTLLHYHRPSAPWFPPPPPPTPSPRSRTPPSVSNLSPPSKPFVHTRCAWRCKEEGTPSSLHRRRSLWHFRQFFRWTKGSRLSERRRRSKWVRNTKTLIYDPLQTKTKFSLWDTQISTGETNARRNDWWVSHNDLERCPLPPPPLSLSLSLSLVVCSIFVCPNNGMGASVWDYRVPVFGIFHPCAQMLMHATAHKDCADTVSESDCKLTAKKRPTLHWALEPASRYWAWLRKSDALPTELSDLCLPLCRTRNLIWPGVSGELMHTE